MSDEEMEGLYDPSVFIAPEMPWLLAPGDERIQASQVFRISLTKDGARVGPMVPMFTDEDLAERFLAIAGDRGAGLEPFQMTPPGLVLMLTEFKSLGINHVCFDPGPGRAVPRAVDDLVAAYGRKSGG